MDSDERDIFNYLKTWGTDFVSVKEICRRAAGRKRFSEEPDWAKPILQDMYDRGVLERDVAGRYRIKPKPKAKDHKTRWMSPDIAKLLKEKGVGDEEESGDIPDIEDFEQH